MRAGITWSVVVYDYTSFLPVKRFASVRRIRPGRHPRPCRDITGSFRSFECSLVSLRSPHEGFSPYKRPSWFQPTRELVSTSLKKYTVSPILRTVRVATMPLCVHRELRESRKTRIIRDKGIRRTTDESKIYFHRDSPKVLSFDSQDCYYYYSFFL